MTSTTGSFHVIPHEELECVWMSAGLLSYWLCDRAYECDSCPLDSALRKKPVRASADHGVGSGGSTGANPEVLRGDRLYSSAHCWTMKMRPGLVRIGLEPGLCSALSVPHAIIFPPLGQSYEEGQTCLWIVAEGGIYPLESPVSGTVKRTNTFLVAAPHLLSCDPFDQGWLLELEIRPEDASFEDLMTADQAASKYEEKRCRLASLVSRALHGNNPQVGVTLADGGQSLRHHADVLGSDRYFSFVRRVYR